MKPIIAPILNLPRAICQHTLGKEHKPSHRMFCGAGVMTAGVLLAKLHFPDGNYILVLSVDMVGYMIHGLGAVPFIEYLLEPKAPLEK